MVDGEREGGIEGGGGGEARTGAQSVVGIADMMVIYK